MEFDDLQPMNPAQLREVFRRGEWTDTTAGLAPQYLQGNLVVLTGGLADDFREFCRANPRPCPLVDVTEVGSVEFPSAPGSNYCTDAPKYRVLRAGEAVEFPVDISEHHRDDMVGFLLGCSFTFEAALVEAGVPVRHLEARRTVPMYRTSVECVSVGRFSGPVVMSMRAIPEHLVDRAVEIAAAMPQAHGAPMHIGDPAEIGVDLSSPDFGGDPVIEPGDVPMFWGCGVTPQEVARQSRLDMITHFPGAMFITDIRAGG